MVTISRSSVIRPINSLMFRTALFYGLIILILLLVINLYPPVVSQNLVVKSKQNDMLDSAGLIAGTLSSLKTLESGNVESAITILGGKENFRILVADGSFTAVYDNSAASSLKGTKIVLGSMLTAMSGMDVFKAVWRDDVLVSYAVVPVVYRESVIGAVLIFDYDTEQAELLKETRASLIQISFFIFAITVFLNVPLIRSFARKFSSLLKGVTHLREGDYSYKIELQGSDELALFAGEFNELSQRLKTTDELRRQFVSDASHEMRTPLAAIKLMADSILQNYNIDREQITDFVGSISGEVDRLSRLTEHLLILSRLDAEISTVSEAVDLRAVVMRTVRLFYPQAEARGITVNVNAAGSGMVLGERDNISQICTNLIENAIKYNRDSGEVDIYIYPERDGVVLRIEDTGPGVPQEDIPRIFERFYRVDKARSRATGGTGLGLAIVRRSVDICGGEIICENRDGGGMRFVVFFRIPPGDMEEEAI